MNRESLNWWLSILANVGVLGGLVFVGYEVQQNTSQLRSEGSRSITEMVNDLNVGPYTDPRLAEILLKGSENRESLNDVERRQFDGYQFSRLNIAEYILDLEHEGVSDLNFRYVDFVVRDFNERPGLQAFIREYEDVYAGSQELLARLLSEKPDN